MTPSSPVPDSPPASACGTPDAALKVLAVDDHYLVREGVRRAVRQLDPGAEVLEAGNVLQAIALYQKHPEIDLVLFDLALPDRSGLESLEAFYESCPDARVVVISASHDMRTVRAALNRGVSGFIPKRSGSCLLINALQFVLDGQVYVPPEVFLQADGAGAQPPALAPLSPDSRQELILATGLSIRQLEVLRLLLDGQSNRQICQTLNLALGTVKAHVAGLLEAMAVETRAEAVAAVDGLGWRDLLRGTRWTTRY